MSFLNSASFEVMGVVNGKNRNINLHNEIKPIYSSTRLAMGHNGFSGLLGLDVRKPDFVACKHQTHIPAFVSLQSD